MLRFLISLMFFLPAVASAQAVDVVLVDRFGATSHCVAGLSHVQNRFNNPTVTENPFREIVTVSCAGPLSVGQQAQLEVPFVTGFVRINAIGPAGDRATCSTWSGELQSALNDMTAIGHSYIMPAVVVRCSDFLVQGFAAGVDLRD